MHAVPVSSMRNARNARCIITRCAQLMCAMPACRLRNTHNACAQCVQNICAMRAIHAGYVGGCICKLLITM